MTMYDRVPIDQNSEEYSFPEIMALLDRPRTWKDIFYYPIYRFFRWHLNPKAACRKVKWFIQRGKRGYADCDVWDLGHYSTKIISAGLKKMAVKSHGWPAVDPWPNYEDWTSALTRVANGLDHYVAAINVDETCTCCGKYCNDMQCPIVIEAFEELMAMWPGLWD